MSAGQGSGVDRVKGKGRPTRRPFLISQFMYTPGMVKYYFGFLPAVGVYFLPSILSSCATLWTSQDQGDIQTARSLLCNAGGHLDSIDASVGGRVEVKTARDILNNTLHHHNVDLDAGACP